MEFDTVATDFFGLTLQMRPLEGGAFDRRLSIVRLQSGISPALDAPLGAYAWQRLSSTAPATADGVPVASPRVNIRFVWSPAIAAISCMLGRPPAAYATAYSSTPACRAASAAASVAEMEVDRPLVTTMAM